MNARNRAKNVFIQLNVGEQLAGYTLTSVEPEMIVFSKGSERFEKYLFDNEKERSLPVNNKNRKNLAPQKTVKPSVKPIRVPPPLPVLPQSKLPTLDRSACSVSSS